MLGKCHVENEHYETVFNHVNVYSDLLTMWGKKEIWKENEMVNCISKIQHESSTGV